MTAPLEAHRVFANLRNELLVPVPDSECQVAET
jgi:hypothetical protein